MNRPSLRIEEIKNKYGVKSMCIGCLFNIVEEWPDFMFPMIFEYRDSTIELGREDHFPKQNYICSNMNSLKYGGCIIGDLGCDKGEYE